MIEFAEGVTPRTRGREHVRRVRFEKKAILRELAKDLELGGLCFVKKIP